MPKHQNHFRLLQIFGSGKSIIVKPECGASCEHSLASTPIPGDRPPLQWDRDDPVSHVNHVDAGHVWLCDLPCFAEVLATACSLLPEFAKVAPSLFQTLTSAALICFERNVCSIEAAAVWSFGRKRHALARAFPRTPVSWMLNEVLQYKSTFLWNSVPLCPRMYWLNSGLWIGYHSTHPTYRSPTVSCNIFSP